MNKIILTKNSETGNEFKNFLRFKNKNFKSINNFTKNDIISSDRKFKNTCFIFSCWDMPYFTKEEIEQYLPSLKAIFYAAGTVKYFAEPFLLLGIKVYSSSLANAIPVAEFVTAQILLSNKGYFQSQLAYKKPYWHFSFKRARKFSLIKKGNYNAKIGIIGCGLIGLKVINFLKPFHLEIFVYDPYVSDIQLSKLGATRSSLEKIFESCDVISNHLPNIPATKQIIDSKLIFSMKDNVTFINTGRGEQVSERSLIDFLIKNPNACALLDVTQNEPVSPLSKLLRLKNVFVTPHIAGSLSNEKNRMYELMFNSYLNFLSNISDETEILLSGLQHKA